ncbi:DUF3576 domain-containing protein [Shimia biformata]|uniref:DUF3576 domain-containing protein n=1 Tax=Shimia biformata TaxID=1294299 RepID=UPI001951EE37|nr:DUF3576 domain-containing protein [Shimia biformata]
MLKTWVIRCVAIVAAVSVLSSCGANRGTSATAATEYLERDDVGNPVENQKGGTSIWDLFAPNKSDQVLNVNKYLWHASLQTLDFLPIETVDPFSGVIVTGYGVPPGGGRSYRATVYIRDPALDARSLHVAMQTRGGAPVAAGTVKAVEEAILTRARQLRASDAQF